MRALFCGLLLAALSGIVLSHDHGTSDHDHSVPDNQTTTESEPECLTTNRTLDDLKNQLVILGGCHIDKGNDMRPLIDNDLEGPINRRLEAIRTCFSAYVNNVSDCYSPSVDSWNMTIAMLQEVEDYFCEGSATCEKLQAFYRGAGASCSNTSDASSCGDNLATKLLFGTSFKVLVGQLAAQEYTEEHCKNESRVGSCFIEHLKTCRKDEPVSEIAEGLQKRIMAATCGVSCLIHSSVSVWLFLVALFSAQRLLS